MSHAIYTTEAIVLDYRDFNEASRWYFLLTPDFGLIVARAQGVREARSKLRGHLSSFKIIQTSLVRGRECWHLIGAEARVASDPVTLEMKKYEAMTRVSGLLRRLLPEAAPDPELFVLVKTGFSQITKSPDEPATLYAAEAVLVWRILRQLGHIEYPNPLITSLEAGVIGQPELSRLTQEINLALNHSQL